MYKYKQYHNGRPKPKKNKHELNEYTKDFKKKHSKYEDSNSSNNSNNSSFRKGYSKNKHN